MQRVNVDYLCTKVQVCDATEVAQGYLGRVTLKNIYHLTITRPNAPG
jgi:hypothetical protein